MNPITSALLEFAMAMTPVAFSLVIFYGLRILFKEKKVQKNLGSVKK